MESILKLFYDEFIEEASVGKIDCGVIYNIIFNTTILKNGKYEHKAKVKNEEGLEVPTLCIKNEERFNEVLVEYVNRANKFYKNSQVENTNFDKTILALLWGNATAEDFANPVYFIERYIDFMDDKTFEKYDDGKVIGESEMLDSKIYVELKKENICNETPYSLQISLIKDLDDIKLTYKLPTVRFGISNNKSYIYAIQKTKDEKEYTNEELAYQKRINRLLYKVNQGLELENESFDNQNNPENLTGITPSSLLAANIAMGLLEKEGFNHIIVPALLITRWNAKEIMYKRKIEYLIKKGEDKIDEQIDLFREEHVAIQRNASDKFIRNFRRIDYHSDGIEIIQYPFQVDSCAHIITNSNCSNWNNPLLEETYNIAVGNNKILS